MQLLVKDFNIDSITVTPKQTTFKPGVDYMTGHDDWLFIQEGVDVVSMHSGLDMANNRSRPHHSPLLRGSWIRGKHGNEIGSMKIASEAAWVRISANRSKIRSVG